MDHSQSCYRTCMSYIRTAKAKATAKANVSSVTQEILDTEAGVCFNGGMTNEPHFDSIIAPGGGWKTQTTHPIFECSDCNRAVGAAIGIAQCTDSRITSYDGDNGHHAQVTWIPALLVPGTERRISIAYTDLRAGIRHDIETAQREGFLGVAERMQAIHDQLDKIDLEFRHVAWTCEIVITVKP